MRDHGDMAGRQDKTPPGRHGSRRAPRRRGLRGVGWKRLLLLGGAGGVLGALAARRRRLRPHRRARPNRSALATATRILYADGSEMGRVGEQNRIPVPLSEVPDDVQRAVLSAEDRGFYTEPGISPKGIARALFTNVRGGGVEQGGSSITQQYAKNAFLTQDRTYTPQGEGGLHRAEDDARAEQGRDPRGLPQHHLLRPRRHGIQVAAKTYFGGAVEQADGRAGRGARREHPLARPRSTRAAPRGGQGPLGLRAGRHGRAGLADAGRARRAGLPGGAAAGAGRRATTTCPGRRATSSTRSWRSSPSAASPRTGWPPAACRHDDDPQARAGRGRRGRAGGHRRRPRRAATCRARSSRSSPAPARSSPTTAARPAPASTSPARAPAGSPARRSSRTCWRPRSSRASACGRGWTATTRKEFPGIPEPIENFGGAAYGRVDLIEATQRSINTAYFELGLEVGPGGRRPRAPPPASRTRSRSPNAGRHRRGRHRARPVRGARHRPGRRLRDLRQPAASRSSRSLRQAASRAGRRRGLRRRGAHRRRGPSARTSPPTPRSRCSRSSAPAPAAARGWRAAATPPARPAPAPTTRRLVRGLHPAAVDGRLAGLRAAADHRDRRRRGHRRRLLQPHLEGVHRRRARGPARGGLPGAGVRRRATAAPAADSDQPRRPARAAAARPRPRRPRRASRSRSRPPSPSREQTGGAAAGRQPPAAEPPPPAPAAAPSRRPPTPAGRRPRRTPRPGAARWQACDRA